MRRVITVQKQEKSESYEREKNIAPQEEKHCGRTAVEKR